MTGDGSTFGGDISAWQHLPHAYVAYFASDQVGDDVLFTVDHHRRAVETQQFEWFDDTYDRGYQGIIGVTEVPDQDLLVIAVQRSSTLILYDPRSRRVVRKIELAGRLGNPNPRFRKMAPEVWVDDYDTLLRLDVRDWLVRDKARLQGPGSGEPAPEARAFIGGFDFNRDESLCAVARPFSGDVVALDTQTFKVTGRARTGRQPLDVALWSDGRVFARDWKTGDLLQGTLEQGV